MRIRMEFGSGIDKITGSHSTWVSMTGRAVSEPLPMASDILAALYLGLNDGESGE